MSETSFTLVVGNRVDELTRIYAAIETFADRWHLPEPVRRAMLLVAEELFTNIVNHGYAPGDEGVIRFEVGLDGDDVALTIRDGGRPFDAARVPHAPTLEETAVQDMKVGGLGLFLVHEFARSVRSHREGDENVTQVRLAAGGSARAAPSA
jgi:serine/threonine-protein kinase RsbW